MRVRIDGAEEEVQASSPAIRRVHGINPSVTWQSDSDAARVEVSYRDVFPFAPPKVFTMFPGTVTLLCPTPFGDVCPPLSLAYIVRSQGV